MTIHAHGRTAADADAVDADVARERENRSRVEDAEQNVEILHVEGEEVQVVRLVNAEHEAHVRLQPDRLLLIHLRPEGLVRVHDVDRAPEPDLRGPLGLPVGVELVLPLVHRILHVVFRATPAALDAHFAAESLAGGGRVPKRLPAEASPRPPLHHDAQLLKSRGRPSRC